jgi:hypothetical protein
MTIKMTQRQYERALRFLGDMWSGVYGVGADIRFAPELWAREIPKR